MVEYKNTIAQHDLHFPVSRLSIVLMNFPWRLIDSSASISTAFYLPQSFFPGSKINFNDF